MKYQLTKALDFESFVKSVHPDHDYNLTPKAIELLERYYQFESQVDTTAIMTCPGEKDCIWASCGECPLAADPDVNLPEGKICPIELHRWADRYRNLYEGLSESDPSEFVSSYEKEIIRKIVSYDIQIARIQKEIANNPKGVIKTITGSDKFGAPIETDVPNPLYDTLKKLESNRASQQRTLSMAVTNRHKVLPNRPSPEEEESRVVKAEAIISGEKAPKVSLSALDDKLGEGKEKFARSGDKRLAEMDLEPEEKAKLDYE